jgi:hypothetical protein
MVRELDGELLLCQVEMLKQLRGVAVTWPPPEALRPLLGQLYVEPAVLTTALQLVVASCRDMQAYKKEAIQQQRQRLLAEKKKEKRDQQQQQQLQKQAEKKGNRDQGQQADKKKEKHDQQQQKGSSATQNSLQVLKLAIPADHKEVLGTPGAWEAGLKYLHDIEMRIFKQQQQMKEGFELAVPVVPLVLSCVCSMFMGHVSVALCQDPWQEVPKLTRLTPTVSSPLIGELPVLKLLFEALLLLYATGGPRNVRHEVQNVLLRYVELTPGSEGLQLLQERGKVLLQAMRLSDGWEWAWIEDQKEEEDGWPVWLTLVPGLVAKAMRKGECHKKAGKVQLEVKTDMVSEEREA